MGLPHAETSDVLQYLRKTTLWNFRNKEVVYSGRSDSLYLVIQGHVLLLHTVPQELVIRFVPPEGLFGDSCLVDRDGAWKREDIERQIQMEPLLGVALLKYAVDNYCEMQERANEMAHSRMPRRVMSGLLRLAQSIGHENPDDLIDLPLLLVHWMIAAYVGTKREAVSVQMSQLRRLGFIRYSRNRIAVDYISLNGAVHKEESMHRRSRQLPIREHSG